MFVLLGLAIVFGSIIVGFTMHGGNLLALVQVSEFIIIGGAAIGSVMMGSSPAVMKSMLSEILGLLKPSPFNRAAYKDLLTALYQVFFVARREGLVGVETHVENPESSEIFRRYPSFLAKPHAVEFFSDTMKVLLTGTVEEHNLAEILELDLERHHESAKVISKSLITAGDALPGFGIVAAVLGVIITMGHIGGSPEEIGHSIGAALVGTFIGILGAYGVLHPLGAAIESRAHAEHTYMDCIRTAILSFARGDAPLTSIEFARRAIGGPERPTFDDVEAITQPVVVPSREAA